MKKTLAVLAVLCALTVLLCGAGYPAPTSQFYASDYAEVLSSETENYIVEQSAALAKETGAQIVVLTVKTLDGETPSDYALHVGREWGVGDKQKNNGVLFLLCPDEGQAFISVGRGLEGALNDAKVGRILDDYAMPYYKQKQFDSGTLNAYKALLSETMQEYGLDGLEGYDVSGGDSQSDDGSPFGTILIVLAVLAFFFFTGGGLGGGRGRYSRRPGGWNDHNNHGGPFIGGGFGGFGGGGGFSGGGGGGFSGGGGSFNGGGSGRSF